MHPLVNLIGDKQYCLQVSSTVNYGAHHFRAGCRAIYVQADPVPPILHASFFDIPVSKVYPDLQNLNVECRCGLEMMDLCGSGFVKPGSPRRYLRRKKLCCSVVDPDPYVCGPPGSAFGSVSLKYGSGSGSAKLVRKTLISTVL